MINNTFFCGVTNSEHIAYLLYRDFNGLIYPYSPYYITVRENQLRCYVIVNSPLDSVDQDSDDVGAESVAARMAHCSAPLGSPGWDNDLEPVSEGQHSRKGWMGGNHLLNIDSALGCRHLGHLDNLQALPT